METGRLCQSEVALSKRDCLLIWKLVEYTLIIRPTYVKASAATEANKR